MSIFKVEIVPIKLEPHPNADTLSIVKVYDFRVKLQKRGKSELALPI
jgi:hypothetical protein